MVATIGAGTAYPTETPEIDAGFSGVRVVHYMSSHFCFRVVMSATIST